MPPREPRRTGRPLATAALLALLVGCPALPGCSFRGSAVDPDAVHPTSRGPAASTSGPAAAASTAAGTGDRPRPPSPAPARASTAAAPTTAGSTAPGSTAPAGDRCHTAGLAAALAAGSAGAGQRFATVVLRNTSGHACRLEGYGGIGLSDASGRPLPTAQVRVAPPSPGQVVLAPGASARSQLHWSAVAGPGDAPSGDCQPVPATLQVIPPDETAALALPWTGGPVCEAGTVDQQAYVAG